MTALHDLIFKSPDPMKAVETLGEHIAASGMLGAGRKGAGVVIVTHCLEKGMSILEWGAEYHIVDTGGKLLPTMKADAMLSRFQREGGTFTWEKDGSDLLEAVLTLRMGDRQQTVRYTTEDAKRAGLIKADKPQSAWNTSRPAMLRARAASTGLRMFSPNTVSGVYTPDELGSETTDSDIQSDQSSGQVATTVQQQAPQDDGDGKPGRGRPRGSSNKKTETGAAEGAGAPAVQTGTAADSKTTETAAAPPVVNDALATPTTTTSPSPASIATAPAATAKSAVDESRFAQVQWLEREKSKFFGLTHEKLVALGVPEGDTKKISLDEQRWAAGITSKTSSAVIAEMTQGELDDLETLFKTREERLLPFVEGKDVEAFLNGVITGK